MPGFNSYYSPRCCRRATPDAWEEPDGEWLQRHAAGAGDSGVDLDGGQVRDADVVEGEVGPRALLDQIPEADGRDGAYPGTHGVSGVNR